MPFVPPSDFPFDDQLPGMSVLLDADKMRLRVQEGFGIHGRLARLVIRGYDFVPEESLRVRYTAEVGTLRYDLTAQIGFPAPDPKLVERLTASARDRRVARLPVARLADVKAQISWYPIDLGLPVLALSDVELADTVGIDSAGPTSQMSWTPGVRAVVRFPKALVRVYRDPDAAKASAAAIRMTSGHIPVAAVLSTNTDEGLVAQELRPGRPMLRDKARADSAMVVQFIEKLHNLDPLEIDPEQTLTTRSPHVVLDDAATTVAFVSYCRPDLAERLDVVLAGLRASAPTDLTNVPSHGDFGYEVLQRQGDDLHIVDIDTLCLSPRALDLATFAVSLMLGKDDDADEVLAFGSALNELPSDAGAPSDFRGFNWFAAAEVLRTLDAPLRGLGRDWPERTASRVCTAELLTAAAAAA